MPQKPIPPASPTEPNQPGSNADEFEQAFLDVARSLQSLKERYAQVRRDQERQAELQAQRQQINKALRQTNDRKSLQAERQQIEKELETIELNLESQLFSWGSLKEPFWQAVRFGGLGVVVGWILKSCTG